MNEEQRTIYRNRATAILLAIWDSVPLDYKRKYALNIWEQFQNAVSVAARTNLLSKFYESLHRKFDTQPIRKEAQEMVAHIMEAGEDRLLLKLIREETAYLVLSTRVLNEERKERREGESE